MLVMLISPTWPASPKHLSLALGPAAHFARGLGRPVTMPGTVTQAASVNARRLETFAGTITGWIDESAQLPEVPARTVTPSTSSDARRLEVFAGDRLEARIAESEPPRMDLRRVPGSTLQPADGARSLRIRARHAVEGVRSLSPRVPRNAPKMGIPNIAKSRTQQARCMSPGRRNLLARKRQTGATPTSPPARVTPRADHHADRQSPKPRRP